MKYDMPTRTEAVSKAHSAITSAHPMVRDWSGLTDVLEELYATAVVRAEFDHQMTVLAYRFAQAIDAIGPETVAERIGLSVEEMAHRIHPDRIGDMTLSEQRLLALSANLVLEYDVIPLKREESTE